MERSSTARSAPPTITATCSQASGGEGKLNILFEATLNELRLARVARAVKSFAAPGTEVLQSGRMVRVVIEAAGGDTLEELLAKAVEIIPELRIRRMPSTAPPRAQRGDAAGAQP